MREAEVDCTSKAKARVRYELAAQVSVATTLDEGHCDRYAQLFWKLFTTARP